MGIASEREVKDDWLRKIFQLDDKYKPIKKFKKYIVDPSLVDINEHSNIWVEYGQRKSSRTVAHFQFKLGLKNQPKPRQQLTDADIEREARAAVIARLTGNSVAKDAKPGETFDQALQRKKELADVKRKLR